MNGRTAPDLFEFNGNILNTTREITSGTGDIIDAYYRLSLDGLPEGGTAINCENSNIGYICMYSSDDYNTDYSYATFKNCIIDESFYSNSKDPMDLFIQETRNLDVLFQDCIFNIHSRMTRSLGEKKALIQNSVINLTDTESEQEDTFLRSLYRLNFDNCTFNINSSLEVDPTRHLIFQCDLSNSTFNISLEADFEGSIFQDCNLSNSTLDVSCEGRLGTVFNGCNLSNSTFDGKNIYNLYYFMKGHYRDECSLTNCIITNVKAERGLFDDEYDEAITIDSSEIRSCSGSIHIQGDINNSQLFNYDCSEQNIDIITCYGNITDSSIYGWTTLFNGEKIQNTSFNFCISNYSGGAVKIGIVKRNILIENCVFSHCKSTKQQDEYAGGGAISIECDANNIEVTIRNCRFNSNVSKLLKGFDIFMSASWTNGSSYSGCVLDLQDCYSDYVTDYGSLFGNSLSVFTNNVTKKGNMLAL